jgi:hypothetical protein
MKAVTDRPITSRLKTRQAIRNWVLRKGVPLLTPR